MDADDQGEPCERPADQVPRDVQVNDVRSREDITDQRAVRTRILLSAERCWLHEPGLPRRPWFRNLYAATDPDSGYAAWMLPGLRHFIEQRDPAGLAEAQQLCVAALGSLSRVMETIDAQLDP